MQFQRSSGVLLHISFAAFARRHWRSGSGSARVCGFLPARQAAHLAGSAAGPTGFGNSPYAAAFGLCRQSRAHQPGGASRLGLDRRRSHCRFAQRLRSPSILTDVEEQKFPLLREAAGNFLDRALDEPALAGQDLDDQWADFEAFCRDQAAWLDDYALYAVLRRTFKTGAWTEWPEPLRRRDPQALAAGRRRTRARAHDREGAAVCFFASSGTFSKRLLHAVRYASWATWRSSSTWIRRTSGFIPEIFELDKELKPIRVAGVPPDYFSATGQRWGNPLYRWDVLAQSGFQWWIERIRRAVEIYDIVRLDHFRGFEAYWAIPASEKTAVKGEWIKAPGLALFRALESALGPLPLVAEDLGVITPEVDALRLELGTARHESAAVRIQRQRRAHPPAPAVCARNRGLHRHARQRHHARLVEYGKQEGTRSSGSAGRPGEQSARVAADARGWREA